MKLVPTTGQLFDQPLGVERAAGTCYGNHNSHKEWRAQYGERACPGQERFHPARTVRGPAQPEPKPAIELEGAGTDAASAVILFILLILSLAGRYTEPWESFGQRRIGQIPRMNL
jgi:hypothetical protein